MSVIVEISVSGPYSKDQHSKVREGAPRYRRVDMAPALALAVALTFRSHAPIIRPPRRLVQHSWSFSCPENSRGEDTSAYEVTGGGEGGRSAERRAARPIARLSGARDPERADQIARRRARSG